MATQVRLHEETKKLLDGRAKRINAARKRAGRKRLTMDDIVFLAIENLTVEQGVEK